MRTLIMSRVLLGALSLVMLFAGAASASEEQLFSAMKVTPVNPPVAVPDLAIPSIDGGVIRLADLRGKVLVLGFFVTDCPSCRREAPARAALFQELKGQGLEMLGVNIRQDPRLVQAFGKEFNIPFPLLLDSGGELQKLLGVRGHPTTLLIDRKGRIVGRILGERNWESEAARRLVAALLERKE